MMKIKAIGIANKTSTGKFLDVYFPNIESNNFAIDSQMPEITNHLLAVLTHTNLPQQFLEDGL